MLWPEGDLGNVVKRSDLVSPLSDKLQVKAPCEVKWGRKVYPAVLAAVGKSALYLLLLSCGFLVYISQGACGFVFVYCVWLSLLQTMHGVL